MGDLLDKGSAWLERQRTQHMTRDVTYARGIITAVVKATIGRTEYETDDGQVVRTEFTDRDFLIRHFVGRNVTYDIGGALLSGTRLFKHTRLLPSADFNQLFCSELAAKVLMRLGRLNRDNPTKYNPASLLRQLVREGTMQFERTFQREVTR